jgi:hypothetical protein
MSTRTSISIGTLIDDAVKQRLTGFRRVPGEYTTSQYFLFLYRKPVWGHYFATVLFQASKGFVTCEVGVSRTEDYPYYRYFDKPCIGVNGFRARTRHLLKGLDAQTAKTFTGPDTLTAALLELAAEAASASTRLQELAVPRIAQEYAVWQPLYTAWQQAERSAGESPDRRYRNLVGEGVSRRILHSILQSGRFDGFLGQRRKFRYREPDFLNCHVFLLAKALAFADPPEPHEVGRLEIDPGQDPDKILFDPIAALSGRTEQDEAVELSERILQRAPEWAFLRSFAALEAFFEHPVVNLAEVRTVARDTPAAPPTPAAPVAAAPAAAKAPSSEVVGLSLDELYGDTPLIDAGLGGPELPPLEPLEAAQPAATASSRRRPDPFELMGPYVTGQGTGEPAKAADPFELLGAQFGLG